MEADDSTQRLLWGAADYVHRMNEVEWSGKSIQAKAIRAYRANRPPEAVLTKFDEAERLTRELIRLADEHDDRFEPIDTLYGSEFNRLSMVRTLTLTLLWKARVCDKLGKLQQADKIRREMLELSMQHLEPSNSALLLRNEIMPRLVQTGQFSEALTLMKTLSEALRNAGDRAEEVRLCIDQVDLLHYLGDFERAQEQCLRARELARGSTASTILLSFYEALIAKSVGDYDRAEEGFRAILDWPGRVGVEFQLARISQLKGRHREALQAYLEIEPQLVGVAEPKRGVIETYKAECHVALGDIELALEEAERAVDELKRYENLDALWRAHWARVHALESVRPRQGLRACVDACECVDELRRGSLGYRLNSVYLADKLPVFDEAIRLSAKMGDAETCLRLMVKVKARFLAAVLHISPFVSHEQEAQAAEFEEVTRRLDAALQDFEQTSEQIEEMRQRRKELIEEIRLADPRWRAVIEPPPLDLHKLTRRLKELSAAMLELYAISDDARSPARIVCVLATPSGLRVEERTLDEVARCKLDLYDAGIQRGHHFDPSEPPYPLDYDVSEAFELQADDLVDRALWDEALEFRRLLIAPNQSLHVLPWAALKIDGSRLFERAAVGIVPSTSCIGALDGEPISSPSASFVGTLELPHSAEAIGDLVETYRTRGGLLGEPALGAKATATNFWRLNEQSGAKDAILHIDSHGQFSDDDPMQSRLVLRDSSIDAASLVQHRMAFREVILAACSTGYRPSKVGSLRLAGDDVIGIPGALLEAGCNAVLASIPVAVDEATAAFLRRYHEKRRELPPLLALQATQREMLNDGTYAPYEWVGFTMYGIQ